MILKRGFKPKSIRGLAKAMADRPSVASNDVGTGLVSVTGHTVIVANQTRRLTSLTPPCLLQLRNPRQSLHLSLIKVWNYSGAFRILHATILARDSTNL